MKYTVLTSVDRDVHLPTIPIVQIKIAGNLIRWMFDTESEARYYMSKFKEVGFRYVHLDLPGNICVN